MDIQLSNGQWLRADLTPCVTLRTDLSPVPATLEVVVRLDDKLAPLLAEGQTITAGYEHAAYTIIHNRRMADGAQVQGNRLMGFHKIIALLESCHKVAFIRNAAIIKENAPLTDIYRAAGATCSISSDIRVKRFYCYVGQAPSFAIARALQEEAAALFWTGSQVRVQRLAEMFKTEPVERLPVDTTQTLTSQFLERHGAPSYFSAKDDASLANSRNKGNRSAQFYLSADQQMLNNLSTFLLQKKVWTTRYNPKIAAGHLIDVAGKNHVVITAAHQRIQGGHGLQVTDRSRFWLGELYTGARV
ncbi:hypothetical protein GCM10009007_19290 [Formosimonas limnophila]|uniref:Uncharacterized protein n=1 Tax=Formosimonas limnophila TaxID=1384487 RepID=A0A8J3CIJ7_9BURK|nr:hypothetical protein [Formosimonas limnophila]GHA78416.1 hypothetical protein GCM10009007_19290 [Formosimonas limnophila]